MIVTSMTTTEAELKPHQGIFMFSAVDTPVTTAKFEKSADGQTATITDWPVFKAGTFADSTGFVETWTVGHLAQMVSNFEILKASLPNIPVRANHSRNIDQVKGYVTSLRVDGIFLMADIQLTEPDAVAKWERTTYRSRSSEIGFYETNDGALHYPVFLGVAFVDLPAVEGLFSHQSSNDQLRYFTEASPQMTTPASTPAPTDTAPGTTPPALGAPGTTATITFGQNTVNPAQPPAAPAPTAPAAPATYTFGDEVLTADQVQDKLNAIAEFQRQQLQVARSSFAADLVKSNRFGAPQEKELGEFFSSLSPEQFAKAQALFAAAPELSVLANHGGGATNLDNANSGVVNERDKQIALHEAVLKQHTRAGMPKHQIEQTESFKALQALRAQGN